MVNVIKDIVNKLDGYSSKGQGFAVTSFAPAEVNGGSGTKLHVKPYLKNEEIGGIPEEEHLMEMIDRLLSRYSGSSHYAVCKAEKVVDSWELLVQKMQEKTEDKANEV